MNSGSLANTWSSYDSDGICWWAAEFPFELGPELLLPWQDAVLSAGDETGIYRVDGIDRIGYRRERDGFLGDFLRTHPDRASSDDEWLPAGFALGYLETLPLSGASTLLAYADHDGQLAETWVHDMYEFASDLGLARSFPYAPFSIAYTISEMDDPELSVVETSFSVSTDIWFPWTTAFSHGRYGSFDDVLDNRDLAAVNGGRLNRFLKQVREAALQLGGTWAVSGGGGQISAQVDEHGVILDAPRPPWPDAGGGNRSPG